MLFSKAAELLIDGKSVWKSPDDGKDHSAKVDVEGGDRNHQATFLLKIPVMGFEVRICPGLCSDAALELPHPQDHRGQPYDSLLLLC